MRRILFFLLASLAPPVAHAASFDCAKAASKIEHIICDNKKISALDEKLARRYRAAMHILSPQGRKLLRDGQRQWLRQIHLACIDYNTSGDEGDTPAQCVHDMYATRVKDMKTAAVRIGPFLFSRVDVFRAEESKTIGHPYELQVSYARIDRPLTSAARAWNARIATTYGKTDYGDCDGKRGYTQTDLEIVSATRTVISAQAVNARYCAPAAHGMFGSDGVNYLLTPALHPLTASDLFIAGKPWRKVLIRHCLHTLRKKDADASIDADSVSLVAEDPKNWTLTRSGLVITFNPYGVLPYVDGITEVQVPWRVLRPYLVSAQLVPGRQ